jgi:ubiquinone biosynthesis monooxygenase Coq7
MIRVDHAGEYGATRIYDGQLAVLGRDPGAEPIRHMAAQEARHLAAFERIMLERRARPSALLPLWSAAGYALGAATALLGPRAAMACTLAVEEVIEEHYARQSERLGGDPALKSLVDSSRADEIEHRDLARAHGAEEAPGYAVLTATIKAGSRVAIWLAERL